MCKVRRINYEVVKGLYEQNFSQGDIAKVYGSVSGHISKVLKAEGVQARSGKEGRVKPVAYSKLPSKLKTLLKKEELVDKVKEIYEDKKAAEKDKTKKGTKAKKGTSVGKNSKEKVEEPKVEESTEEASTVAEVKVAVEELKVANQPKEDTPKVEQSKVEMPKVEQDKVETPKVETSKVKQPKVAPPKVESKKVEEAKKVVGTPKKKDEEKKEVKGGNILNTNGNDLDHVMRRVFEALLDQTELKKVHLTLKDVVGNAIKREMSWVANFEESKKVFNWIDNINVGAVKNLRNRKLKRLVKADDVLADVAMQFYYGTYSAIDPSHCKKMGNVQTVIKGLKETLKEVHPTLQIDIIVVGLGDALTVTLRGKDLTKGVAEEASEEVS